MGKFSDKFLNAFMKGDDEYDDDFDEYDDILDEDEYFPEDNFEEVPAPAPKKKERAECTIPLLAIANFGCRG